LIKSNDDGDVYKNIIFSDYGSDDDDDDYHLDDSE